MDSIPSGAAGRHPATEAANKQNQGGTQEAASGGRCVNHKDVKRVFSSVASGQSMDINHASYALETYDIRSFAPWSPLTGTYLGEHKQVCRLSDEEDGELEGNSSIQWSDDLDKIDPEMGLPSNFISYRNTTPRDDSKPSESPVERSAAQATTPKAEAWGNVCEYIQDPLDSKSLMTSQAFDRDLLRWLSEHNIKIESTKVIDWLRKIIHHAQTAQSLKDELSHFSGILTLVSEAHEPEQIVKCAGSPWQVIEALIVYRSEILHSKEPEQKKEQQLQRVDNLLRQHCHQLYGRELAQAVGGDVNADTLTYEEYSNLSQLVGNQRVIDQQVIQFAQKNNSLLSLMELDICLAHGSSEINTIVWVLGNSLSETLEDTAKQLEIVDVATRPKETAKKVLKEKTPDGKLLPKKESDPPNKYYKEKDVVNWGPDVPDEEQVLVAPMDQKTLTQNVVGFFKSLSQHLVKLSFKANETPELWDRINDLRDRAWLIKHDISELRNEKDAQRRERLTNRIKSGYEKLKNHLIRELKNSDIPSAQLLDKHNGRLAQLKFVKEEPLLDVKQLGISFDFMLRNLILNSLTVSTDPHDENKKLSYLRKKELHELGWAEWIAYKIKPESEMLTHKRYKYGYPDTQPIHQRVGALTGPYEQAIEVDLQNRAGFYQQLTAIQSQKTMLVLKARMTNKNADKELFDAWEIRMRAIVMEQLAANAVKDVTSLQKDLEEEMELNQRSEGVFSKLAKHWGFKDEAATVKSDSERMARAVRGASRELLGKLRSNEGFEWIAGNCLEAGVSNMWNNGFIRPESWNHNLSETVRPYLPGPKELADYLEQTGMLSAAESPAD